MPFRRRYAPRKPFRTLRRYRPTFRMRKAFKRRKMRVTSKIHSFVRTYEISDISAAGGAMLVSGVIAPTMSLLPNYTEFTSLYDQYRICKVVVTFLPRSNVTENVNTQVVPQFPTLYTIIDRDDATPIVSTSEALQYQTLRISQWSTGMRGKGISRAFKPKTSTAIWESAISTGYGESKYNQWLDLAFADIPHYGLKYYIADIDNSAGESRFLGRAFVKVYFQCKNVR